MPSFYLVCFDVVGWLLYYIARYPPPLSHSIPFQQQKKLSTKTSSPRLLKQQAHPPTLLTITIITTTITTLQKPPHANQTPHSSDPRHKNLDLHRRHKPNIPTRHHQHLNRNSPHLPPHPIANNNGNGKNSAGGGGGINSTSSFIATYAGRNETGKVVTYVCPFPLLVVLASLLRSPLFLHKSRI